MKLNTLIISLAAFAGLASTANAYSTAPISAFDNSSSQPHALRPIRLGDRKLDARIALPSKLIPADAGVSTAVICFAPAGGITNDNVPVYDVRTGAWSLDNKPKAHANSACLNELQG